MIHPDHIQSKKMEQQVLDNNQRRHRESEVGHRVRYRNYSDGPKWLPGLIVGKAGPSSYKVQTDDGLIINRHIDQIIRVTPHVESSQGERRETNEVSRDSTNDEPDRIIEFPSEETWADIIGILR